MAVIEAVYGLWVLEGVGVLVASTKNLMCSRLLLVLFGRLDKSLENINLKIQYLKEIGEKSDIIFLSPMKK